MTPALHTVTINGKSVRFFRSPLPGPDYPWHAPEEIMAAIGLDASQRALLTSRFNEAHPEHCRTLDTTAGPKLIASHLGGVGMFHWLIEGGWQIEAEFDQFCEAMATAFGVQTAHLPLEDFRTVNKMAAQRFDGASGSA